MHRLNVDHWIKFDGRKTIHQKSFGWNRIINYPSLKENGTRHQFKFLRFKLFPSPTSTVVLKFVLSSQNFPIPVFAQTTLPLKNILPAWKLASRSKPSGSYVVLFFSGLTAIPNNNLENQGSLVQGCAVSFIEKTCFSLHSSWVQSLHNNWRHIWFPPVKFKFGDFWKWNPRI